MVYRPGRLYQAAAHGDVERVRQLLAAGTPVNERCGEGGPTPLHTAVARGHEKVARLLLQAGANPNFVDNHTDTGESYSCLHEVASSGRIGLAAALLQAGANPNILDTDGQTALHIAAACGSQRMAQKLLEAGADPTVRDNEGLSAMDFAPAENEPLLELLNGAMEAWARPFLLQMSVEGGEPDFTITFRTLAGNVAAVVNWAAATPVQELPGVTLGAMKAAGFQAPFEPFRAQNLRIVRPDGALLDLSDRAPPFLEQLAASLASK